MKGKPHEDPNCACQACLDHWMDVVIEQQRAWLIRQLAEIIRNDPEVQAAARALKEGKVPL